MGKRAASDEEHLKYPESWMRFQNFDKQKASKEYLKRRVNWGNPCAWRSPATVASTGEKMIPKIINLTQVGRLTFISPSRHSSINDFSEAPQ